MKFESSYYSTSELYKNFLSSINEIKFTLREVDVMACLINNRGEKKIASILEIAPRTVSTHVYNITNKLNCNSRDQIIDFIENTGQINHFREYYLHLLLKHNFSKFLKQFASKVAFSGIAVTCDESEMLALDDIFLQIIKKDCKLSNIHLNSTSEDDSSKKNSFDFSAISKDNYYFNFIEYISNITRTDENADILQKIKEEFLDYFNSLQDVHLGKVPTEGNLTKTFKTTKLAILSLLLVPIAAMVFYYGGFIDDAESLDKEVSYEQKQEILSNLEHFLSDLRGMDFSADNVQKNSLENNHSLFKYAETILDYLNHDVVKQYFADSAINSKDLNNYIYNLHALASYYMRNLHDGATANQVLIHAKEVAENYINQRSRVKCNFEKMTTEEILAELSITPGLAETYTRILYLIGRSYLYIGKNSESEKYFRMSEAMSLKLNLFEAYISYTAGLFRIEKDKATKLIEQGKIKKGSKILESIIEKYNAYLSNPREYIKDFRPDSEVQVKIIPGNEAYNKIELLEVSLNIYNKLIDVSNTDSDRKKYFKKIEDVIRVFDTKINDLLNKINEKKVAIFYNNLGNTFILMSDSSLDIESLKDIIRDNLKIKSSDPLEMAEELFNMAMSISRSTDFTKADSYDGLIRVYKVRIEHLKQIAPENLSLKIEELMFKIKTLEENRDQINQALNRTQN